MCSKWKCLAIFLFIFAWCVCCVCMCVFMSFLTAVLILQRRHHIVGHRAEAAGNFSHAVSHALTHIFHVRSAVVVCTNNKGIIEPSHVLQYHVNVYSLRPPPPPLRPPDVPGPSPKYSADEMLFEPWNLAILAERSNVVASLLKN